MRSASWCRDCCWYIFWQWFYLCNKYLLYSKNYRHWSVSRCVQEVQTMVYYLSIWSLDKQIRVGISRGNSVVGTIRWQRWYCPTAVILTSFPESSVVSTFPQEDLTWSVNDSSATPFILLTPGRSPSFGRLAPKWPRSSQLEHVQAFVDLVIMPGGAITSRRCAWTSRTIWEPWAARLPRFWWRSTIVLVSTNSCSWRATPGPVVGAREVSLCSFEGLETFVTTNRPVSHREK